MQALNSKISTLGKVLLRYFLVWMADALSLGITALLLPGIYFVRDSEFWFLNAFTVALGFALLNVLVRPLLIILILPINFISLGLTTLILNGGLFYLIAALLDSFVIERFTGALIGMLVLTTVNTLLGNIIRLGNDYSIFSAMMDKLSTLTRPKMEDTRDRGLVIVQIDGLAHETLQRAIDRGRMPFVATMLNRGDFALKKWFCGLPSQTSAVQAGMFYGSSYDIPGFRWYSKKEKREIVSSNSSDMNEIDMRLGKSGNSLLKGGTCILSLLHGGAQKKLLTLSVILEKDFRRRVRELEDFAIFSMHPYLYNRAFLFLILDFLTDRMQSLLAIIRRKKPRIKRNLRSSFLRAIGTAFLREGSTFFLIEDLVRGIPVVYVNYVGYDIVSHHSGPHTHDAISTLSGIDRQILKINRAITNKAARHYDLVVLSDHGQSRSIPFTMLHGQTLAGLIEEKLKTPSTQTMSNTAERTYFATLLSEMELVENAFAPPPLIRGRRTLEKIQGRVRDEPEAAAELKGIVVCSSGNLAHVYFTESPGRVTTEQLLKYFPTFLDMLVSHPGIGFVVTINEDGEILVMGKRGMHRLRSGQVEGKDPLRLYHEDDGRKLGRELLRLCEYPSAGDVIINGSFLDNGAVVTFEDQVGTHGGAGGLQTEPFIVYPKRYDSRFTDIGSSEEMHDFLSWILSNGVEDHRFTERSQER
ncbi:MAG: phage holin family protein [Candidatus Latescibacterota bacterium]